MSVLGLLLILLSAGFAVWLVWDNTQDASLTLGSASFDELTVGGVFVLGVVTAVVFGLGLVLARAGAKRSRARRAEVKALRRERDEVQTEMERTRERDSVDEARMQADRDRLNPVKPDQTDDVGARPAPPPQH